MGKQFKQEFHQSVMPDDVIKGLNCLPGKIYVDCTVGGAGHSVLIAQAIKPDGKLICLDVDDEAVEEAKIRLKPFNNTYVVISNYLNLPEIINNLNIEKIDGGILLDLGASYHQLTSSTRGFTFQHESFLDMRMDKNLKMTACEIVNSLDADKLTEIFSQYGEERYSKRIAKAIVEYAQKNKIETTTQLANIVKSIVPSTKNIRINPATRVFQALRIAVNNELEVLKDALEKILEITSPGARIVIITFHSLEDRIVKRFFKYWSSECVCAPEMIECRCEHTKKLNIITKKPIIPSDEELRINPSSRSAKLRIAERM